MSTPATPVSPSPAPTPALPFWLRQRHKLEWAACAFIGWLVPKIPRRACVKVARFLGWAAYHLDARSRRIALDNLACLFPERPEAERRRIALASLQNFARTMFDLFWSPRLTPENWRESITVEVFGAKTAEEEAAGEEAFRQAVRNHGAVSMCIHWGNFEWSSHAVGFLGVPTQIVAETFKNPSLSRLFNGCREVSGHTIIPQEHSMIRLLKVVKRHGAAGMLVDLTVPPQQAAVPVVAFGQLVMSVTFLHAVLAQRGGARMFPVDGIPQPDGTVRVVINKALEIPENATPQQIAQACWDFYEPRIRERPELYLWSYKHWRYRPEAARPAAYPGYAYVSPGFEALLKEHPGVGV